MLLASALVIAASWALTPPYEPRGSAAADEQAAKGETPAPGAEAALLRVIGELQEGHPVYARMNKNLADAIRAQPGEQRRLANMGPVKSVGYLGGGRAGLLPGTGIRFDRFRVTFQGQTLLWIIALGEHGVIDRLGFNKVGLPTPQDVMDGYASFPAGTRALRWAEQFAILLLLVPLLGRFVLRLRL